MVMPTSAALPLAHSEPRSRTALLLEAIALRHQIAVLERSGTRRPCFTRWDRLFWILLSRCWSLWRDSLIIVEPETVMRWRRNGWLALWRYRARGRWRRGRPRVSREVRHLIGSMARENFLWGAPRIHGELLMLGFSVSEATVSRYLRARGRTTGTIVADFCSQSSHVVRSPRVCRGTVEGRRWPASGVPAQAMVGRADCEAMG